MIDGEDTREEEDGVKECGVDDELDPVCGLGISRCAMDELPGRRTVNQVDVECPHALALPRRCVISAPRFDNVHQIDEVLCMNRQSGTR